MNAVGASHVDAVFDFNAAVGVELVDFVEGYAEDEVHEDVENSGGFLCALTDPDFDVKFVSFLGAGDVSGGIFVVFLKDVNKVVCASADTEDFVEDGMRGCKRTVTLSAWGWEREIRELLVDSYMSGVLSDEEFVVLYDSAVARGGAGGACAPPVFFFLKSKNRPV